MVLHCKLPEESSLGIFMLVRRDQCPVGLGAGVALRGTAPRGGDNTDSCGQQPAAGTGARMAETNLWFPVFLLLIFIVHVYRGEQVARFMALLAAVHCPGGHWHQRCNVLTC
jgi:hypothetical protein